MVMQYQADKLSKDKRLWHFTTDNYKVEIFSLANAGQPMFHRERVAQRAPEAVHGDRTYTSLGKWKISRLQAVLYARRKGTCFWDPLRISTPFVVMHGEDDTGLDRPVRFRLVNDLIEAQRRERSLSRQAA